jgi:hypothetical protein
MSFADTTMLEGMDFSLVRGGPLYGFRRAIGLIPKKGFGLAERAAAIVAITWVPIVAGAVLGGRAFEGQGSDPLLRHFAIHARLLLSAPLLICAETLVEQIVPEILRQFVESGLVDEKALPHFRNLVVRAEHLRDSNWGLAFVLAAMVTAAVVGWSGGLSRDEMSWAAAPGGSDSAIRFAAWWYNFVGRPVFSGLLAVWVWRLCVGWKLLAWISKLKLRLVPTHPDGVGGLGFLEEMSTAFAPLVLAVSVAVAGHWAHDVLYHGAHVRSLQLPAVVFVSLVFVVFLGPLSLFVRTLYSFRRRSLLKYSTLVGTQGRLVCEKWIHGRDVGDPAIFHAPEIGPVADTITLYGAVSRMRTVPLGKRSVIPLLAAALLPIVLVFAIEVPIKDVLMKLAGALL